MPSASDLISRSWTETLVVGHRGAAAYVPENTLPSFLEAIESGADAVECDIHLSSDGEMVVIHDATLDRTTSLKGAVADTPWTAMKAAGVPSLAEVAAIAKDRVVLIAEIKDGDGIEEKLVEHLIAAGMREQTIVFSFHTERLAKVHDLDPMFYSVWLLGEKIGDAEAIFVKAKQIGAAGIGLSYPNVHPEFVAQARHHAVPIFAWTVPPGPEVDRLKTMKVNFIVTNHPRDVKAQLRG